MMVEKNHYHVLNVSSSATTAEIKKSFRKLAQQYHPDKNSATATVGKFEEIYEAYVILSNPEKRNAYNYRLYRQNPTRAAARAGTAEELVFLAVKLQDETLARPVHHIDRDLLFFRLSDLLAAAELVFSKEATTETAASKIITAVIACSRFLPYAMAAVVLKSAFLFAMPSSILQSQLTAALRQGKQQFYWNRYKTPAALLLALLLCFFIFLLAR